MTNSAPNILTEIAITRDAEKRRELLRRACDLFEVASSSLSDRETLLFDEILEKLSQKVDVKLRGEVSERLADQSEHLERTATALAFDEEITVASPVLQRSPALSDDTLVEVARTRGQAHMSSIAVRPTLTPVVTDTLVDLGDNEVLHNVAENKGARFSGQGMERLTDRSRDDELLQTKIAEREDLTPDAIDKLLSVASFELREQLRAKSERVTMLVEKARVELEAKLGIDRVDFKEAERKIRRITLKCAVDESLIKALADQEAFGELVVALGILMSITVEQAKQLLIEHNALLVAAKSSEFSPQTLRAILHVGPVFSDLQDVDRENIILEFDRIVPETARRVMRFWRTRSKLAAA